jgi:hypothetical protein
MEVVLLFEGGESQGERKQADEFQRVAGCWMRKLCW